MSLCRVFHDYISYIAIQIEKDKAQTIQCTLTKSTSKCPDAHLTIDPQRPLHVGLIVTFLAHTI